ncbi:cell envelope integrity protein TolA [Shimia sediminis]|uniref:cell envelope integrity protein TolA n=1 Tax=Shimia sediminis TaxID=2497945 RepID=UPI000F8DA547|nr:cell envelope integrity protein TolA [Shimia sediminis]
MSDQRTPILQFISGFVKYVATFLRTSWKLVLVASLLVNLGLGVLSFVLQPIWKAAEVASAIAATKAKAELAERRAVAKTKAEAEVEQKAAVSKAVAKEKARGRVRRVAVAVPMIGAVIASGFEYSDYKQWKNENPDGDIEQYTREVASVSAEVANEVIGELPEALRFDPEKLWKANDWIVQKVGSIDSGDWTWPDVSFDWFNPSNWSLPSFGSEDAD